MAKGNGNQKRDRRGRFASKEGRDEVAAEMLRGLRGKERQEMSKALDREKIELRSIAKRAGMMPASKSKSGTARSKSKSVNLVGQLMKSAGIGLVLATAPVLVDAYAARGRSAFLRAAARAAMANEKRARSRGYTATSYPYKEPAGLLGPKKS